MLRTFALSAIALAVLGTAAAASSNQTAFRATLETPADQEMKVVVGNDLWACDGNTCSATLKRKKATVRTCQKLAREVGTFTAFESENGALDEAELKACNSAAK